MLVKIAPEQSGGVLKKHKLEELQRQLRKLQSLCPEERHAAYGKLREVSECLSNSSIAEYLLACLSVNHEYVVSEAIVALNEMGFKSSEYLSALVNLVSGEHENVKIAAIRGISNFGPGLQGNTVDLLIDQASNDNAHVRFEAIYALADVACIFDRDKIAGVIQRGLDDSDQDIQDAAIDGLVSMGYRLPDSQHLVTDLLNHADPNVRSCALRLEPHQRAYYNKE